MEGISPRILAIHEAITEICSRAINAKDDETIFHHICNILVERAIYSAASIGTVDKEHLKAKTMANAGLLDFPTEFQLSDLPELERNSPYVCNTLTSRIDKNLWATQAASRGFLSMAVFPIKIANNIAALFSVYSRTENTFLTEELAVVEKLGSIISDILVHTKLDQQKRRAQMELQRSEAIYSRVAERIVGMICEIDEQGTITFVSESQKRILGFEVETVIGKRLTSFIHPQYVDALDSALTKVGQSRSSGMVQLQMKCANGEYVWVELVSDPVEDEAKRLSGFVVAIRDITENKKLLEGLQKQIQDLEEHVKERTERIRTLNETSSKRVGSAIRQIYHISEIRDRLKGNPGFKSGFSLILKSAIRALAMDAGGIFVLNPVDRSVETKAMTPCRNSTVKTVYKLDESFVEFESLYKRETISRLGGAGRSLLGTGTIHCAPISLSNSIRGFLALGSDGRRTLDESDSSILKLYSALVADLLKSTSLNVEPAKEVMQSVEGRCRVDSGNAYLVPDDVALAYELFIEAIMSGTEGLCITRTMPARIREKYNLLRTPMIWLTDETVEGEKTIHSLQDLSILISNYVQRATKPVILVDGIEYLISHKGFASVYHLLQSKRTQMEANNGILIVPFFRDAMEPKEAKLLEREFRVFGAMTDVYGTREGLGPIQIPNDFY